MPREVAMRLLTLTDLMRESARIADEHGFVNFTQPDAEWFPTFIALVHTELSEAFECWRNGHEPHELYGGSKGPKTEGVPSELADVIIRVLQTCEARGIPLREAIRHKMKANDRRPFKHGGKRV